MSTASQSLQERLRKQLSTKALSKAKTMYKTGAQKSLTNPSNNVGVVGNSNLDKFKQEKQRQTAKPVFMNPDGTQKKSREQAEYEQTNSFVGAFTDGGKDIIQRQDLKTGQQTNITAGSRISPVGSTGSARDKAQQEFDKTQSAENAKRLEEARSQYAQDPEYQKLQNTLDTNKRLSSGAIAKIKEQQDSIIKQKSGITTRVQSPVELSRRTRDYAFGGQAMTEAEKLQQSIDMPEDTKIEQNEDGTFKYTSTKGNIEADPYARAEAQLTEDRQLALDKIDRAYEDTINSLRSQTNISGKMTTQTKKKLANVMAEKNRSIEDLDRQVDRNRESMILSERKRQAEFDKALETETETTDPAKLIKEAEAQELLDDINAKITSGEATSITEARILVERDNKLIGQDTGIKDVSKMYANQLKTGQIEAEQSLSYLMSLPSVDGDLEKANKIMKLNNLPDSLIDKVNEDYSVNTLGLDPEYYKEKTELEKLVQRKTDYFSGGMLNDSMGLDLVGLANSMKDEDLEQALYQQVLSSPNTPEHLKTLASLKINQKVESTGVDRNLFNAVQNNPELFSSLRAETRESLLKSGFTPASEASVSRSFDELLSESPTLYGIPMQLVNSDSEKLHFKNTVRAGLREGKSRYEIQKAYLGFDIKNKSDDPFANSLLNHIQTISDPQTADYQNVARLINSGQKGKAIDRVEKRVLQDTGGQDFIKKKTLTDEVANKAADVLELLQEVPANKLGAFDAQSLKFEAFTDQSDPDYLKVKQLQSKLTAMIQPWRKENLGSAVTPSEEKALADLIASASDQPELLSLKVQEFANSALIGYNAARRTSSLPEIGFNELLDKDAMVGLYEGEFKPEMEKISNVQEPQSNADFQSVIDTSNTKYDQNKLVDEYSFDFAMGTQELPIEDQKLFGYLYNNDKSEIDAMQQQGLNPQQIVDKAKDFMGGQKKKIKIKGNVTGYGSKYWKHGLDFVSNEPIKAPEEAEVIDVIGGFEGGAQPLKDGVKQNKGWGNQVKLRLPNGDEMWVSHLASVGDFKKGQKIPKGTELGSMGNTGRTYSESGGSGAHYDVTMRKPDKSYYTPQEVEKFILS